MSENRFVGLPATRAVVSVAVLRAALYGTALDKPRECKSSNSLKPDLNVAFFAQRPFCLSHFPRNLVQLLHFVFLPTPYTQFS